MTAGILHDVTKETPFDEQLKIITEGGIILDEIEKSSQKLWHPISGSVYIQKYLDINDADIINAIRFHTTGRSNMSLMEKISAHTAKKVLAVSDNCKKLIDVLGKEHAEKLLPHALGYALLVGHVGIGGARVVIGEVVGLPHGGLQHVVEHIASVALQRGVERGHAGRLEVAQCHVGHALAPNWVMHLMLGQNGVYHGGVGKSVVVGHVPSFYAGLNELFFLGVGVFAGAALVAARAVGYGLLCHGKARRNRGTQHKCHAHTPTLGARTFFRFGHQG